MIKIGYKVIRRNPPDSYGVLKRGHIYLCLDSGETGIVTEIFDDHVYIEGFGSYNFHIKTLKVIP